MAGHFGAVFRSGMTCRAHLVRPWVQKFEIGALDEDAEAADRKQEYEARIAALKPLVGRQALALEFSKGLFEAQRGGKALTSAITGPVASASPKDAG